MVYPSQDSHPIIRLIHHSAHPKKPSRFCGCSLSVGFPPAHCVQVQTPHLGFERDPSTIISCWSQGIVEGWMVCLWFMSEFFFATLRVCQLLRAGGGSGFCCCCCRQYSCSHCFGLNISRLIPYVPCPMSLSPSHC